MIQPVLIAAGSEDLTLRDVDVPIDLDALLSGGGPWEVEIGFGKGRYLLRRSQEDSEARFLGIEVVSKYCRLLVDRGRRRGVENLVGMRGEAIYLMSAVLPRRFARTVHVYFPDPWPKTRHHKRRLFDPERLDLLLDLLLPGGSLVFASDFLEYGGGVRELLHEHPALEVTEIEEVWPDGARTNYEAKYIEEGRPIIRLEARLRPEAEAPYFHPRGAAGGLAATSVREDD